METDAIAAPSVANDTSSVTPLQAPKLGTPAYDHWRKTGEFSADEPKKEDAAPSKESSESTSSEQATNGKDKSASAPDAEHTIQEKRSTHRKPNAESRIAELIAENKRLKAEAETRKAALSTQAEPSPAKPAPAQESQSQTQELKPPVKPDFKSFEGKPWEEWEAAKDKYQEDLATYSANKAVLDYQQQQAKDAAQREFNAKVKEGRERYKDFDDVAIPAARAIMTDKQVPQIIAQLVNDSPVFTDLLYVLGGDQAQFNDLLARAKANPREAIMLIAETERLVIEELNKKKDSSSPSSDGTPRNENGQFVKSTTTPEKKVTAAPPIGSEVNTRSSPPGDEVAEAAKKGKFSVYKAAADKADLARFKAKR